MLAQWTVLLSRFCPLRSFSLLIKGGTEPRFLRNFSEMVDMPNLSKLDIAMEYANDEIHLLPKWLDRTVQVPSHNPHIFECRRPLDSGAKRERNQGSVRINVSCTPESPSTLHAACSRIRHAGNVSVQGPRVPSGPSFDTLQQLRF